VLGLLLTRTIGTLNTLLRRGMGGGVCEYVCECVGVCGGVVYCMCVCGWSALVPMVVFILMRMALLVLLLEV